MPEKPKTTRYKFFTHKNCEFYPCHGKSEQEPHNCLFCFCPLYALKDKCGGEFVYNEEGIKDCSNCKRPHTREGYDYIVEKFKEIKEITKL